MRQIAIVERQRAWTVEEWVCHWIWFYLIDEIDSLQLETKLDEVRYDMPGALEPWFEVESYLGALYRNAA